MTIKPPTIFDTKEKQMPEENIAAAGSITDDGRRSYHLEEYKALREEIAANISRTITNFQYVLFGSAALYSFLLGYGDKASKDAKLIPHQALAFLWWAPTFLSVLGLLHYWSSDRYIRSIGGYLAKLERAIGFADLGWEKHLSDANKDKVFDQLWAFVGAWIVIAGLNAWLAYLALAVLMPG